MHMLYMHTVLRVLEPPARLASRLQPLVQRKRDAELGRGAQHTLRPSREEPRDPALGQDTAAGGKRTHPAARQAARRPVRTDDRRSAVSQLRRLLALLTETACHWSACLAAYHLQAASRHAPPAAAS